MEITTILTLTTIIGFALSVGTFFIGRTTASRADGKQEGQILAELNHIKSGVDEMKTKLDEIERFYHDIDRRVGILERQMQIYHNK